MRNQEKSDKPFNPVLKEGVVSSRTPITWETVKILQEDNIEAEITEAVIKENMRVFSFFFRQYKFSGFPTKHISLTPDDLKKLRRLLESLEEFYRENA